MKGSADDEPKGVVNDVKDRDNDDVDVDGSRKEPAERGFVVGLRHEPNEDIVCAYFWNYFWNQSLLLGLK